MDATKRLSVGIKVVVPFKTRLVLVIYFIYLFGKDTHIDIFNNMRRFLKLLTRNRRCTRNPLRGIQKSTTIKM